MDELTAEEHALLYMNLTILFAAESDPTFTTRFARRVDAQIAHLTLEQRRALVERAMGHQEHFYRIYLNRDQDGN